MYDSFFCHTILKRNERITTNGIDYGLIGDYYIPDMKLPEKERPIGKYGRMYREYLREEIADHH